MIHQVMVITNVGICIYNHSFTDTRVDSQLIGGFTTAIDAFSAQLTHYKQNIEMLQMSELEMHIESFSNDEIAIIVFVNKYDHLELIDDVIFELKNLFLEKFGHIKVIEIFSMEQFNPFDEIVLKICKTSLDIGIISPQSQIKQDFWHFLSKNSPKSSQSVSDSELSTLENLNIFKFVDHNLTNCDVTFWNIDIENEKLMNQLLENKNFAYILIEPNMDFIAYTLPKLFKIRQNQPNLKIYGIVFKQDHMILSENLSLILKIPIFEFTKQENQYGNLQKFIRSTILGTGTGGIINE